MPCEKTLVTITFDGATARFSYADGGETTKYLCCCSPASVDSNEGFLWVAGERFQAGCIVSVGGNASGNLLTYLGLIEAQIVANC